MIMVKSPAFVTCLILKVYVYFKINHTFFRVRQSLSHPFCYVDLMNNNKNSMILNPEYYNSNIVTFKGQKVRIFPSTRFGNTISGDILNGPDEGKMTTVFLDQIEK